MKALPTILVACCACSAAAHAGTVTLTSNDVTSAPDIEAAINTATNFGTEKGTVILDGSQGEFVYSGPFPLDTSINVFRSNFTLRGINNATIANCDDGLFFDDFALDDIVIEDMTFHCTGDGIDGAGLSQRTDVIIRRNVFETGIFGIIQNNAIRWSIMNNTINAGTIPAQTAVALFGGRDSSVVNNSLSAFRGVWLTSESGLHSTGNQVTNNRIEALETGVRLEGSASGNTVAANRITLTSPADTGIFLDSGTSGNKVLGNQAEVTGGGSLTTVQDFGTGNMVSGNKP